MTDYEELALCKINVLKDAGFTITKDMKILDFGCGEGHLVKAFRNLGYDAYGIDVIDCEILDDEHFHKIGFDPYVIPFDDAFFDVVISTSVFEHVLNTEESLREIHRVLKVGGVTIHSLPSRYRIIEPHIKVPFAGLIQGKGWLKLWALLGVRNEFQEGLPWQEVADRNIGYCHDGINYMSYHKFKGIIKSVFGNVRILTKEYIKNTTVGMAAKLGRMLPIPGYGYILFFFREWNLIMKKE